MENCRVLAGFKESKSKVLLHRALTLLNPNACNSLVIDIGCGEGHVIEYITTNYDCTCMGVENDPLLVERARKRVQYKSDTSVAVLQCDAEQFCKEFNPGAFTDISVYMFLSYFGYEIMGHNILNVFPIGTRVVTVGNPVGPYWTPLCVWLGDDAELSLYLHIVTAEAKASISQDCPINESWIHPPPGSYHPRPIPIGTAIVPCDASEEEALSVCNADATYYKHTKREKKSCSSLPADRLDSSCTSSSPVDKKSIPLPPPLPPLV